MASEVQFTDAHNFELHDPSDRPHRNRRRRKRGRSRRWPPRLAQWNEGDAGTATDGADASARDETDLQATLDATLDATSAPASSADADADNGATGDGATGDGVAGDGALSGDRSANGSASHTTLAEALRALQADGTDGIEAPEHAYPLFDARDDQDGAQSNEPAGADRSEIVDPELIRLLQGLDATIDTARHVLYAAANAQARYSEAMEREASALTPPDTLPPDTLPPDTLPPDTLPPDALPPEPDADLPDADAHEEGLDDWQPSGPPPPPDRPAAGGRMALAATVSLTLAALAWAGWQLNANPSVGLDIRDALAQPGAGPELADATGGPTRMRLGDAPGPELAQPMPNGTPSAPTRMAASAAPLTMQGLAAARQSDARADGSGGEPARGPAGQPIVLDLALPERGRDTELSVMIQGAPEGVELSGGRRVGADTWILTADEARRAALLAPASFPPQQFALDVTLVTSDGRIPQAYAIAVAVDPPQARAHPSPPPAAAAGASDGPAITPVALEKPGAAPHLPGRQEIQAHAPDKDLPASKDAEASENAAPMPAPLGPDEERRLLARGADLMAQGDISAARVILGHAARRGSAQAMLALGKSYDPEHLERAGVQGIKADRSQAVTWYERAARADDR